MRASLLLLTSSACALTVTIDNTVPRRDTNGNILNAHDGNIVRSADDGLFYMVGTSYTHCKMDDKDACAGTCPSPNTSVCAYPMGPGTIPNHPACGWTNNDFALYSSPDLREWTLRNPSLLPADARPNGVYFRPKLVYNPRTSRWVLWFNFVTEGVDCATVGFQDCWSTYGTATSMTAAPSGPFTIAQLPVRMGTGNASVAHGDFALFGPDVDGRAYVLYNAYDHRSGGQPSNSVDELTEDFTASVGASEGRWSGFFAGGDGGDEAQVMLRHNGTYYAIVAEDCCFCSRGSQATVYTAPSPLGPWSRQNDINTPAFGNGATLAVAAQQAFVIEITQPGGGVAHLWAGDRWQSADDGFKSHDYQTWLPLSFDAETGAIKPLRDVARWNLTI